MLRDPSQHFFFASLKVCIPAMGVTELNVDAYNLIVKRYLGNDEEKLKAQGQISPLISTIVTNLTSHRPSMHESDGYNAFFALLYFATPTLFYLTLPPSHYFCGVEATSVRASTHAAATLPLPLPTTSTSNLLLIFSFVALGLLAFFSLLFLFHSKSPNSKLPIPHHPPSIFPSLGIQSLLIVLVHVDSTVVPRGKSCGSVLCISRMATRPVHTYLPHLNQALSLSFLLFLTS